MGSLQFSLSLRASHCSLWETSRRTMIPLGYENEGSRVQAISPSALGEKPAFHLMSRIISAFPIDCPHMWCSLSFCPYTSSNNSLAPCERANKSLPGVLGRSTRSRSSHSRSCP